MNKTFLRSGRLENYLPMGENGQAVYISALQLRETLRLQKKNKIADCLAIPQPNETGERIDWYSPVDGPVISWATASDEEKENAYTQLNEYQNELLQFSQNKKNSENKEYQLFGALLEKTIQFPDDEHIYIVGGQPVITFWGFVNAGKQSRTDPVACLQRRAKPAPVISDIPEPAAAVKKSPLRFLLWLLPLLLLLCAALFFLRGCQDTVTAPAVTTGTLPAAGPVVPDKEPVTDPVINTGTEPKTDPVLTGVNRVPVTQVVTGRLPVSGVVTDSAVTGTVPGADPAIVDPAGVVTDGNIVTDGNVATDNGVVTDNGIVPGGNGVAEPVTDTAGNPVADPATQPGAADNANTTTDNTNAAGDPAAQKDPDPQTPGNTATPPDLTPAADNNAALPPISIPPDAVRSGSVQFLNGQWKAGAGIQDQKTGKALSLQYNMNNEGKGEVVMTRSDGVTCKAPVSAAMKSGTLHIDNSSQAGCSDGSAYRMPVITCQPGAKNIAECQGEYNKNQKFPISMKRESN